MAKSFAAQVSERVATYKKRLEATFKASAQDMAEEMTLPTAKGGRMRVKTGFLRSSLMASTASMPRISTDGRPPSDAEDESFGLDAGSIEAVILGAQLGETIYLGFTAAYARPREYHDGFVEGAALNWQQTVDKNAKKAIQAFP